MHLYRKLAPRSLRNFIYKLRKDLPYWGFNRYCPACGGHSSRFRDFDLNPLHVENGIIPPIVVTGTLCPWCGSHLHHRLMWTVLPDLLEGFSNIVDRNIRILHFAPEPFSIKRLQNIKDLYYITTDYLRSNINVKLDMCQLGIMDASIDLIIASHVLEHVSDDIAALRELYRIVRPGGIAVLLVPLLAHQSFEYDSINSDADRLRLYGQKDHVRAYGLDFSERVANSGFQVEIINAQSFLDLNRPSYLLNTQGVLFLARKPRD